MQGVINNLILNRTSMFIFRQYTTSSYKLQHAWNKFAAFQQLFQEKYDLIFLWSFAMSFRKSKEKKEKIITQWYNTVVAKNIKKYGAQVFSFVIQL